MGAINARSVGVSGDSWKERGQNLYFFLELLSFGKSCKFQKKPHNYTRKLHFKHHQVNSRRQETVAPLAFSLPRSNILLAGVSISLLAHGAFTDPYRINDSLSLHPVAAVKDLFSASTMGRMTLSNNRHEILGLFRECMWVICHTRGGLLAEIWLVEGGVRFWKWVNSRLRSKLYNALLFTNSTI